MDDGDFLQKKSQNPKAVLEDTISVSYWLPQSAVHAKPGR